MRFFRAKKSLCIRRDRLSDLPDEILCHIISLLPIKETVRTSVLSTRWLNLFTLISTLNLDEDKNRPRMAPLYGFMSIVDRVLLTRQGIDVDKFRVKCGRAVDPWRAQGWIQYALGHNVRNLELELGVSMEHFILPTGLLTRKTLVTLKLQMEDNYVLQIPSKVSLPCLKKLHLKSIEFSDDDSVERLFSSCSTLEELVVQSCNFENITEISVVNSTLKRLTISHHPKVYEYENLLLINAPSLLYFKYFHFIAKDHILIGLHSLVEACIDFGPVLNSAFYDSGKTDLIRGISHVQSLHLSGPFSEALLFGNGPIPTLENMTYLKIGRCYPEGWERVLNFAPQLDTLVFEELPCFQENIMNPPKEVPLCLTSQMKAIKFQLFRGKKSEMQMVEYFLKHAEVLENLTIHIIVRKKPRLRTFEQLLKFPRGSKKCQVLIV
ncbi:hypothetical protein PTKIN_Ptkin14bG0055300 [Pterospermum kingtungense]